MMISTTTPWPEVRPARESDYEALCPLWGQGDALHAQVRPDFFQTVPGLPRSHGHMVELLARQKEKLLVAEMDQVIVGLVHVKLFDTPEHPLKTPRRRGYVDDIVVLQEHRRRGVGRTLMSAAAQWCREQGGAQLLLTVWAGNEQAEAFYRKLGYRPVNRVLGLEL